MVSRKIFFAGVLSTLASLRGSGANVIVFLHAETLKFLSLTDIIRFSGPLLRVPRGACVFDENSQVDVRDASDVEQCRRWCQLEADRGCEFFTYFPTDSEAVS